MTEVWTHDEFVELIGIEFVITNRTVVDFDGNVLNCGINRWKMTPVRKNPQNNKEEQRWQEMYI